MEFRKVFDTIPEQFDRYRPRYCRELFDYLIGFAKLGPEKQVLEIGPGTGQATEPILETGCDYNAIELGEHLYAKMKEKYDRFPNFHIVNGDFITYDFGQRKFDLIYSAATIQWIPEKIAFSKTFELLKPGGILAMMLTKADYKTTNEALYSKIQTLYDRYFKPETPYTHGGFKYENAPNYGYMDFERHDFHGRREMSADEYVAFCGTHCDHIVIPEPYKTLLFEGLRNTVEENGGKVVFEDTHVLYLAKKPQAPLSTDTANTDCRRKKVRAAKGDILIRDFDESDLPLMLRWLTDERVLEYYEGRDADYTEETLAEDYLDELPDGFRVIIEYRGEPIGYGQAYMLSGEMFEEYDYPDTGQTVFAMDQFIGVPEYWSKGIGTEFLKLTAGYLKEKMNAEIVLLDPHKNNARAIYTVYSFLLWYEQYFVLR